MNYDRYNVEYPPLQRGYSDEVNFLSRAYPPPSVPWNPPMVFSPVGPPPPQSPYHPVMHHAPPLMPRPILSPPIFPQYGPPPPQRMYVQPPFPSTLPPPSWGQRHVVPQAMPPRPAQHQQGPVHTSHLQSRERVTSSDTTYSPVESTQERQELQAKAKKQFHLLSKSELKGKSHLLAAPPSRDNYRDKFHHLLYWEEHEHEVVLRDRCSGSYYVCLNAESGTFLPPWLFKKVKHMCLVEIWGMTEDQCDYAKQAATDAKLVLGSVTVQAQIQHAGLSDEGDPILFVGLRQDPPAELKGAFYLEDPNAVVRFVLKHSYFQNLHRAVECLSNTTLSKLLPRPEDLKEYPEYSKRVRMRRPKLPQFGLDYDYQFETMKNILYSAPSAPFLVMGPFGTGKTRMLATAAYMFLMGESAPLPEFKQRRILLVTHHIQTADSYLENYFGPAVRNGDMHGMEVVRLILNDRAFHYNGHYREFIKTVRSEKLGLHKYQLIITTLLTAPHLVMQCGFLPGFFSHILVDEAAQAREPELTAALSLADEHTKLVFAGDHLQVGPDTLVLGEEAQRNGLGQSLLRRLHSLYQSQNYSKGAVMYTSSLLTNWRSHHQIVKMLSKLFYRDSLQCRSDNAKLPPNTTYPLHFICTSTAQGQRGILADEEDLKEQGEKEACAVLEAVKKYCIPWPHQQWGKMDMDSICIIAPSRMQQRTIRKKLKMFKIPREVNTEVAFDIQGREYRAVFLCTSEPVLEDGSTANPTKSICDKFVFNTVITRAQSLVVAVGNPFRLFAIEEKSPNGAGCWKEYVTHCYKNHTVQGADLKQLRKVLRVGPNGPEEETEDLILDSYAEAKVHGSPQKRSEARTQLQVSLRPGRMFSKMSTPSKQQQKLTDAVPAKVKQMTPQPPSRKASSASATSLQPAVIQPLVSPAQTAAMGRPPKVKGRPAIALESSDEERKGVHQFAVDASSAQRNISQEIPVQSVQQSRERYPGVVKQQSAMVISAAAQALPPALEQNATVTTDDDFPMLTISELKGKSHLLAAPLSRDNYRDKFHHLLYWEEHEHEVVLRDRCNGIYEVEKIHHLRLPYSIAKKIQPRHYSCVIQILGMTVDQCEYATQAATECKLYLGDSSFTGLVGGMGTAKGGQPALYLTFTENLKTPSTSASIPNVKVEFLLKHTYFQNLHRAVNWLPNAGVRKLLPNVCDLKIYKKVKKCRKPQSKNFVLDYEYQFDALRKILQAPPDAPFIVSGPFGTGKTKLLATATLMFLQGEGHKPPSGRPRILLAAHHLQTADSYLDLYFGPAKNTKQLKGVQLVRLVVNNQYRYRGEYEEYFKVARQVKYKLGNSQLIITTLLTALQLKWHCKNLQPGFFTHILVDEAAQAREPELTAVLSLADEHTKVILGGDHLQVGPRTLVLGKEAKENGLGVSVLERLHTLYHSHEYSEKAEAYSASLLTNYRSHPGILRLPSHLFYDATLQCRSTSELHPKTQQPLHFICTSLKQGKECVLASEADLIDEGQKEVIAVLDAVKKYCTECPKEWRRSPMDSSFLETICIVTPWRHQCRSTSELHPKTQQPLHFIRTSLKQGKECVLASEADLIDEGVYPQVLSFHSSRQHLWDLRNEFQHNRLLKKEQRQVFGLLRKPKYRHLEGVDVTVAYDIQGRQYCAVFLCTSEPVLEDGSTANPTKSICDKSVFNTVITRAQSLVVAAGNPFRLFAIEEKNPNGAGCWNEYVRHCMQCRSLEVNAERDRSALNALQEVVFRITTKQLKGKEPVDSGDTILEAYNAELSSKTHNKNAKLALRSFDGDRGWTVWTEEKPAGKAEVESHVKTDSGHVLCRLEQKSLRKCIAQPMDPTRKEIILQGVNNRRCAFDQAIVKVQIMHEGSNGEQYGRVTKVVEQGDAKQVICQVDQYNAIFFFPVDRKSPKIVNLPQLARTLIRLEYPDEVSENQLQSSRHDVICFDPESVKPGQVPKVRESIPLDIAVHLLFVVWPLNWDIEHRWPLGVVVGAIPKGETFFHAEHLLKVQYQIDDPNTECDDSEGTVADVPMPPAVREPHWEGAITIDPEGAINLDDALTLTELELTDDGSTVFEFGVHIANVGRYLPQKSKLDDMILEKSTSVYGQCQGEFRFQPMLPKEFSSKLSLNPQNARYSISVTAKVIRAEDGSLRFPEDESVDVCFIEDTVHSLLQITYEEAETLLECSDSSSIEEDSLRKRVLEYNEHFAERNLLTCQERLSLLSRISCFLHQKRLGPAVIAFPLNDSDSERHPQAHFLVSELMIWANASVARRLLESRLPAVLLRVQPPPNQQKIEMIQEEFSSVIASTPLFVGMQPDKEDLPMTEPYIMLADVKDELMSYLKDGKLQQAHNLLCSSRCHPQLAVVEAHCARAQNRAQYQIITPHDTGDENGIVCIKHHSLNTEYTHFTSPLRRAADVIVQRMLLQVLDGVDNASEDSVEELKNAVRKFNVQSTNAKRYENALSVLDTAIYANRSSIRTTAYISNVTSGSMELIYADHALRDIPPQNRSIKASILIAPSYDGDNGPEQCIWRLRIGSLQHEPPVDFSAYESKDFVKPRESRQLQANVEDKVILFVPSNEDDVAFCGHPVVAKHKQTAVLIPPTNWAHVQKFICDPDNVTTAQVLSALCNEGCNAEGQISACVTGEEDDICTDVSEDDDTCSDVSPTVEEDATEAEESSDGEVSISVADDSCVTMSNKGGAMALDFDPCKVVDESTFCSLDVPISLTLFKDHKVWLTCSSAEHMLTVQVQLMEMAPQLHICVQHRSNPVACFTNVTTKQASKSEYNSIDEYRELWIDTFLAECASSSIEESKKSARMILVRNVPLPWPELEIPSNAYDEPYYQPKGKISFVIPEDFVADLGDFFQFEPGCLVCARYEIQIGDREIRLLKEVCRRRFGDLQKGEDHVKRLLGTCSDGYVRAVFHMVVLTVKDESKQEESSSDSGVVPLRVTLAMKGENKVSQVMAALLTTQQYMCDMELCPLTNPSKRIFRSLVKLEENCLSDSRHAEMKNGPNEMITNVLLKSIVLGDIPRLCGLRGFLPGYVERFLEINPDVTQLWPSSAAHQNNGILQGQQKARSLNKEQVEAIKWSMMNRFQLIQGPPGTGKSVTGAHLAYAFALLNRAEKRSQRTGKPCVLYCGPSNKSVEVVLRLLKPMSHKVKILSIYGKMIERLDYPAPVTGIMEPKVKQSHQCPEDLQEFALHHKVHRQSSHKDVIVDLEAKFRRLNRRGAVPRAKLRRRYKEVVSEAEEEIIHKGAFDIVLCTCSEAASGRVNKNLDPVQCIIDEAAMAMEPECLAAISKAYHVVLIGDHKQLQPVIGNRKAKENGLGTSLFERYAMLGTDGSTLPFITMLRVQYRMQLAVCWFPSECFYDGKLRPHSSVGRATIDSLETFWPNAKWPIVFCDIDGHEDGNTGTQKSGKDSKSNSNEAAQVAKIVDVLLTNYSVHHEDVAILTPYTAQKELIKRKLSNEAKNIKVRTITESQGSEFRIVILSTVRSQPAKDIENEEVVQADRQWMRENLGFVTDEHQICVGITRSQLGLVIVGNSRLLQYDKTWKQLVEHYKQNKCLVKGRNFPPIASARSQQ